MDYKKIYNEICNTTYKDQYIEKHHIIPKCLNGSNEKENIALLSAKAHYIAHWLLCKIYPNNKKISFAFWTMNNRDKTKKRYITSKGYAFAKLKRKDALKNNTFAKGSKRSLEFKKRMSESKKEEKHPMFGKKHKEETLLKMKEARKKYIGKDHPRYGKKINEDQKRNMCKRPFLIKDKIWYSQKDSAEFYGFKCGGSIFKRLNDDRYVEYKYL